MEDDMFNESPYPETLTRSENPIEMTNSYGQKLLAQKIAVNDEVKSWNPRLLQRIGNAANLHPMNACLAHLSQSMLKMDFDISLVLDGKVYQLPALTDFANDGFKPTLALAVKDFNTFGFTISLIKPIFDTKAVDTSMIKDINGILRENAPQDMPVVNPRSSGAGAQLTDAFKSKPPYEITRIDPLSVDIEYLAPIDGSTPEFRVLRKNGNVINGARVIYRDQELVNDGNGNMVIRSPVLLAWSELYKYRQGQNSVDTRIHNMSAPVAFEPADSKIVPNQPQLTTGVQEGVPVTTHEHAAIIKEWNQEMVGMGQNTHMYNVDNWYRWDQQLREWVNSGAVRTDDPNYTRSAPVVPAHLKVPHMTAPTGFKIVTLSSVPESPMTKELLDKREDIVFATLGVNKMQVFPPEVMGASSFEQLAEYAQGVSQDRKDSCEKFLRIYMGYVAMDIHLPVILDFISKSSDKRVDQEIRRAIKEKEMIQNANRMLTENTEGTSDEGSDAGSDVDEGPPRKKAKTKGGDRLDEVVDMGSDSDSSSGEEEEKHTVNQKYKNLTSTGISSKKGGPLVMANQFKISTGVDGSGNISYLGWSGIDEPEVIMRRRHFWHASLISQLSIAISVKPPPSAKQQLLADRAWVEGFLPAEERALFYAAQLKIPRNKLNTPLSPYEIQEQQRKMAEEAAKHAQKIATASLTASTSTSTPAAPKTPATPKTPEDTSSSSSPSSSSAQSEAGSTPKRDTTTAVTGGSGASGKTKSKTSTDSSKRNKRKTSSTGSSERKSV